MPVFNVQSPSGHSFSVDAASEAHAADYVARRFFSGFEATGNPVEQALGLAPSDEPDARLLGPFEPSPDQEKAKALEQQRLQQYLADVFADDDPEQALGLAPSPQDQFVPSDGPSLQVRRGQRSRPTTNRPSRSTTMRLKRARAAVRFSNYLRGF